VTFFAGGRAMKSVIGIKFCSLGFWLLKGSLIIIGMGFTLYYVFSLPIKYQEIKRIEPGFAIYNMDSQKPI